MGKPGAAEGRSVEGLITAGKGGGASRKGWPTVSNETWPGGGGRGWEETVKFNDFSDSVS